ncbi:MAG TPA: hypothetical protein VGX78_02080 [Pirellulales bacterium]|nr:hypothetical protein [Pirellulales bacterium]
MNGQANVHSVAALEEFKAALVKFVTEAREALSGTDMQVRRGLDWFQHDLLKHWQSEHRKREDAVVNARVDLERCRMQKFGDRTPDCTDQRVALKKAQARLEEAEQKVKAVKKWSKVLQDEADEYRGASQELGNTLAGEMPKALHDLKRMLDALYAYLETTAPSGAAAGATGDASAGGTMARGGDSTAEPSPAAAAAPAIVGGATLPEDNQ